MTEKEIIEFLKENQKYLPKDEEWRKMIVKACMSADSIQAENVKKMKFKNPAIMQAVSILLGWLGIDRLILGDFVFGFMKMFVCCGVFGIGWLIDIVRIKKDTRYFNAAKLLVYFYPGKIKKPTFFNMFFSSKKNTENLINTINSAKGFRDTFDIH